MKNFKYLLILAIAGIVSPACIPTGGGSGTIAKAIYLFNGNANDGSGKGKHGTVYGATLTTDRFGNANKAYYFGNLSSAQYIELPTYTSILGSSEDVSISFWCKFGGTDRGPTPITLYPDNPSDRMSIAVPYHPTASPADIYWDHGDIYGAGRLNTGVYTDDAWHHYVCIKSATDNVMEIYRDNVKIASKSGVSGLSNKDRKLRIGGTNEIGWFIGAIDDVKIYGKRLTQAEVTRLFNNQSL